jgi:methyl-accepting chemotaxis protein
VTETFVQRVAPDQRIVFNFVHKMVTLVARGSAPLQGREICNRRDAAGRLVNLRGMIETNFGEIDAAVGQSTQEASSASQAATATSSNAQMMASAAEESAASVSEIAQSMATSRVATDIAFAEAKSANEYTDKLSSAAEAMGASSASFRASPGRSISWT